MRPRTKRQRQIFDYIGEFIESHGYDPSYKQIAQHFGMNSKGGIAKHIVALENQGLLVRRREDGRFRLELNPKKSLEEVICRIDWLSFSGTGETQTPDFELFVPKSMTGIYSTNKLRGFIVPDSSMLDAQIREGDIAIIEKREFARDGDCVVAEIPGGRVIMRGFRRSGADIEFVPANKDFERLKFAADEIEILGVYRPLSRA